MKAGLREGTMVDGFNDLASSFVVALHSGVCISGLKVKIQQPLSS